MKQSKKAQARLAGRIADWAATIDSLSKRNQNTTGYHKPGSNKK